MKRLIPACVLALLLTVLCIVAYSVTKNRCDDTKRALEFCETAFKTGDTSAVDRAQEFVHYWEKNQKVLAVFTAHDLLDKISYSAARLCGYADAGQGGMALAECAEIRQFLDQLYEEQHLDTECFY